MYELAEAMVNFEQMSDRQVGKRKATQSPRNEANEKMKLTQRIKYGDIKHGYDTRKTNPPTHKYGRV